jgi:hypothetical protein
MVQLYLTPHRCLIDYYDDPGILHKPAQPGKEGSTRYQSEIQCIISPAPAFSPPGEIPGSCYLTGNRRGDEHGQALPAYQRPCSGLFPLYFFPRSPVSTAGTVIAMVPGMIPSRSPAAGQQWPDPNDPARDCPCSPYSGVLSLTKQSVCSGFRRNTSDKRTTDTISPLIIHDKQPPGNQYTGVLPDPDTADTKKREPPVLP